MNKSMDEFMKNRIVMTLKILFMIINSFVQLGDFIYKFMCTYAYISI